MDAVCQIHEKTRPKIKDSKMRKIQSRILQDKRFTSDY